MFERYTEKARRVIFFARYEASEFGSPYIETEHLLLGLLREDKTLSQRIFPPTLSVDSVRAQVEQRTMARAKTSTSIDLPLSEESKRVLAYAAEEAERLNHPFIGTEHLLLGLLRERDCFAATLLAQYGVQADVVRADVRDGADTQAHPHSRPRAQPRFFGKYRGVVVENADPDRCGRVQAAVPDVEPSVPLVWAWPCIPYPTTGTLPLSVPPIGASVWVEFEGGDPQRPIWSGCFWAVGQSPLLNLP